MLTAAVVDNCLVCRRRFRGTQCECISGVGCMDLEGYANALGSDAHFAQLASY